VPILNVDPLAGPFGFEAVDGFGFDWAVPTLVLAGPGLLLMLAILAQGIGMVLWLPIVRRWRRGYGSRRSATPGLPAA
jgi:hypothetical protein